MLFKSFGTWTSRTFFGPFTTLSYSRYTLGSRSPYISFFGTDPQETEALKYFLGVSFLYIIIIIIIIIIISIIIIMTWN